MGTLAQPLSYEDFKFLVSNNGGKVTALNEKGEYCSLSKTDDFIPITKSKLEDIEKLFIEELFWHKLKDDKLDAYDLLGLAQHQFWQNNAPSLGLKYETNFSHLR